MLRRIKEAGIHDRKVEEIVEQQFKCLVEGKFLIQVKPNPDSVSASEEVESGRKGSQSDLAATQCGGHQMGLGGS